MIKDTICKNDQKICNLGENIRISLNKIKKNPFDNPEEKIMYFAKVKDKKNVLCTVFLGGKVTNSIRHKCATKKQ